MAEAGILKPTDRVELIEGEIVEMSPIGDRHAMAVNRANMVFARGLGDKVVVSVQNAVRINRYNEPQPDIVLIRPREGFYGDRHPRPEDVVLLIEVADTTLKYDQNVKLPIYARNGIREVWILDLQRDVIHLYREPENGSYTVCETRPRSESVSPQAFPGFAISAADLLG
jgi:Uma2 family endonuclease